MPDIDDKRFSTLRCGSWIDAVCTVSRNAVNRCVSVPFDAGRGLMPHRGMNVPEEIIVSVPFDAGRGLMRRR